MVNYNLKHLTQSDDQNVLGPIQDDEALFLFSVVRAMRLKTILEFGGLSGYSARNFLEALQGVEDGKLYTVDLNEVPCIAPNHTVLTKNALDLTAADIDGSTLDLVFFDCHDMVQMEAYDRFKEAGLINDRTILALHDTNLHYEPFNVWGPYVPGDDGYAHQPVERAMVNAFVEKEGYHAFCLHTTRDAHSPTFPFRHGVTLCSKFKRLE